MSGMQFPDCEEITEDMKQLSKQEKLELIAKEGQTLYEYCTSRGFSTNELKACIKPFARPKTQALMEDSKSSTFGIAVLIAVVAIVIYYPPAYNLVCVHGKLATMKLLPYWDWTYIYAEDCIIYNKFQKTYNMTEEDCQSCLSIKEKGKIDVVKNVTQESMSEEFLWVDYPAIVEDGQRDWPINESLTLEDIISLYKDGELDKIMDCFFNTTISDISTIEEFLDLVLNETMPAEPWMVTWENCDLLAAKLFRRFYKRPYFFAPMAEASRFNQIFLSEGYSEDKPLFEVFNAQSSATWLAVIHGSVYYELYADDTCQSFGCDTVTGTVKPGEILIVPHRIWKLEFGASSDEATLAVLTAVNWDEM